MLAWMVYVVVVTLLLGAAAFAAEGAAQIRRTPTRWLWGASIVASLVLPIAVSSVSIQIPSLWRTVGALAPPTPFALRQLTLGAVQPSAWLDMTIGPLAEAPGLDTILARAWAAASALILLAMLVNGALLRRSERAWAREAVAGAAVHVSQDVGPAVVGLVRPRIVIPRWIAEAPAETQALVLAHEQSHLDAGDAQLLALAVLLICIMPWNLPLWWLLRRLRFAIEVDCDARVLKSGHDVSRYGEALILVGQRQSRPVAVVAAMSESRSFLEQRIRKMLRKRTKFAWAAGAAMAALGLVLAASAAEVSPPNAVPPTAAASPASARANARPGPDRVAFRLVDDAADAASKPDDERVAGPGGRELWLAPGAPVSGADFASARPGHDELGQPAVDFTLTPEGKDRLAALTRENIGRRLVILVDGKAVWAPVIRDEISAGKGQISGRFTPQEVQDLAAEIMSASAAR